ncbi:hypothetical protein GCM10017608_01130 [Agromyces luteolus]|uniref:Uncharacterized protein n=1 Tax=Agromyces luteolus TaxID=88373 RepID=A0A7C9MF55_9MICO|nr:hypothetical protein [Agromyces luteolus]MUN05638.1 hypothetical protein [Agromyces luteolus]GLK26181.1 hypothetical protein GCM10017608_01130 [Agromyces luteolus]
MRAARGLLIAVGLGLAAYGGFLVLTEIDPSQWIGIAVWVGAAILLHDGVVAPVVVAVGLGAASVRGRVGDRGVAIAQGALVVGAILTAITVPALVASTLGNPNPTILVGSYGIALAVIWAVLLALAAIALRASRIAVVRAARAARTK